MEAVDGLVINAVQRLACVKSVATAVDPFKKVFHCLMWMHKVDSLQAIEWHQTAVKDTLI